MRKIAAGIAQGFRSLWRKVKEYPVRAVAVVESGLALGMGFGLAITPEQMALILTFSTALLALLVEKSVTPLSHPRLNELQRVAAERGVRTDEVLALNAPPE